MILEIDKDGTVTMPTEFFERMGVRVGDDLQVGQLPDHVIRLSAIKPKRSKKKSEPESGRS